MTAEFNRNLLHVLNRELGADFEPARFERVARWKDQDEAQRIEMWLRSTGHPQILVADLDLELTFGSGEEMLTEDVDHQVSRPEALKAGFNKCGFVVQSQWPSEGDEFPAHPGPTLVLEGLSQPSPPVAHPSSRCFTAASTAR